MKNEEVLVLSRLDPIMVAIDTLVNDRFYLRFILTYEFAQVLELNFWMAA